MATVVLYVGLAIMVVCVAVGAYVARDLINEWIKSRG